MTNGALVVLYHKNLDSIKANVIKAGGEISKDTFSFTRGRPHLKAKKVIKHYNWV